MLLLARQLHTYRRAHRTREQRRVGRDIVAPLRP